MILYNWASTIKNNYSKNESMNVIEKMINFRTLIACKILKICVDTKVWFIFIILGCYFSINTCNHACFFSYKSLCFDYVHEYVVFVLAADGYGISLNVPGCEESSCNEINGNEIINT